MSTAQEPMVDSPGVETDLASVVKMLRLDPAAKVTYPPRSFRNAGHEELERKIWESVVRSIAWDRGSEILESMRSLSGMSFDARISYTVIFEPDGIYPATPSDVRYIFDSRDGTLKFRLPSKRHDFTEQELLDWAAAKFSYPIGEKPEPVTLLPPVKAVGDALTAEEIAEVLLRTNLQPNEGLSLGDVDLSKRLLAAYRAIEELKAERIRVTLGAAP